MRVLLKSRFCTAVDKSRQRIYAMPGDIIELDDKLAMDLIARRAATEAPAAKQAPAPEHVKPVSSAPAPAPAPAPAAKPKPRPPARGRRKTADATS